ncbi:hypothetical protein KIN20_028301 [Parelaphostrongylus tenuis]|uniref:Uncharacterized protein n=1 Tax=Parelaphostrongylus tenuis TaxID=148309 RepID=A0AAD5WEL7_PARTN|nr:hypothetical protein KIN20_028301 [Parelaphostrongylus tenuis]
MAAFWPPEKAERARKYNEASAMAMSKPTYRVIRRVVSSDGERNDSLTCARYAASSRR